MTVPVFTPPLGDGSHDITLTATDNAQNKTTSILHGALIVDETSPAVVIAKADPDPNNARLGAFHRDLQRGGDGSG